MYLIQCRNTDCGHETQVGNIRKLQERVSPEDPWLRCEKCGGAGYFERSFPLQEDGQTWEPYIHAMISLGSPDSTYQPYVFLVSDSKADPPDSMWFCYFKDTRASGGKLKHGHGPGGPPVLSKAMLLRLLTSMKASGMVTGEELEAV